MVSAKDTSFRGDLLCRAAQLFKLLAKLARPHTSDILVRAQGFGVRVNAGICCCAWLCWSIPLVLCHTSPPRFG